jgi:hypothetical protein
VSKPSTAGLTANEPRGTAVGGWHNSIVAGHYRIQGLLGEGGIGEFYHAYDENLKTEVVLKVPTQECAAVPARSAAPQKLHAPGLSARGVRVSQSFFFHAGVTRVRRWSHRHHSSQPQAGSAAQPGSAAQSGSQATSRHTTFGTQRVTV